MLNLKEGNSIHAFQTRLFVKRCLYDELLIKNNKVPSESWKNSFLFDQVFGSSIAKFTLFTKKIQGKANYIMNKYNNRDDSSKK